MKSGVESISVSVPPVVLLVFNRPEQTRRLLSRLSDVRPSRILVVCDGPRADRPDDHALVAEVRSYFENLPWPCSIERNFAETNMGCGKRVSTGLNWAFGLVDAAIILEDDCLPNTSFFYYVSELLDRYRDNPRVGAICGTTCGVEVEPDANSYRFSRYCPIWGWATWRRAWLCYDYGMMALRNGLLGAILRRVLPSLRARLYWRMVFMRVARGRINTWDYQWVLSCWEHGLLSILPSQNLVDNIGFSSESSHTSFDVYELKPAGEIGFPLRHPSCVEIDQMADDLIEDRVFSRSLLHRLIWVYRRTRGYVGRFPG